MRAPLGPGALIAGKYLLERLLGQGGMGSVYAAQNTLTGKQVAIKCLHQDVAASPEAALRFKREARASARVRHPNVIDVYDVISEDGAHFLIMEYLEGEPLSALLASHATSLPDLIRYLTAAMRGVAAAHREGVIHRDIKPENIFLAREGDASQIVPKVLDFGISKIQGTQDLGLTAPGAALGTVLYMSIEQLHGVPDLDVRADVYAFGVILYQAVTGCAPFEAETLPALIMRIMTEHPAPVKELRPDAPPKLAHVIEWAMAREREQRLPTLERFIAELEPFADDARYHYQLTRPFRATPLPRVPTTLAGTVQPLQPMPSASAARHVPTQPAEPLSSETPFVTDAVTERQPPPQTLLRAALTLIVLSGLTFVGFRLWQARFLLPQTDLGALLEAWLGPSPEAATTSASHGHEPAPEPEAADESAANADVSPSHEPSATAHEPSANDAAHRAGPSARATDTETDTKAASDEPRPALKHEPVTPRSAVKHRASPSRRTPRSDDKRIPARAEGQPATSAPAASPNCNPTYYLDSEGEKHFKPECYR